MANPVIKRLDDYENESIRYENLEGNMSISGTMGAFGILGITALIPALITWNWAGLGYWDRVQMMMTLGVIAGLILCLVICFKPKTSPYLSPVYAVCEGMFLGGISAMVQQAFGNIVIQAVAATFAVVLIMLFVYMTGIIRVTEKFLATIFIATMAIGLLYLISFISSLFGFNAISSFLWSSNPLSIGVSALICIIAALNLLLDFDRIEFFSQRMAPKYMEWYCAFGLVVTIVWLYMEILRFLSIFQRR